MLPQPTPLIRDDGLSGKVAIITGGASGIGQALAVAYAKAGVSTVVGYYERDQHDVGETLRKVNELGGTCMAFPVDVRDSRKVDMFARAAIAEFGRLDIAVSVAGILRGAPLEHMNDEAWHDLIDVDLNGVMRTFRAASGLMKPGSSMLAVSSIAGGRFGMPDHSHYAAAKAGVVGLCRSLASELAKRQIRVNAVIPGLIETPQSLDEVNAFGTAGLAASAEKIPLGRVGSADEVARVLRFLSSDDASYITGQEIVVDGGVSTRMPL